ncbi:hypothetical protein EDWATA_02675 [Edwardsiella tarda ATCC 23685]|uniref:Uncharacterized protein n=1 Tax=Edwardsiella tarda ATCC 23685 TaxID=500638 RepID=D4F7E0_EDWTA|nr:hypothetical protein EDWATA_02675 [Edwardsiella tarda ATCC 23685]
MRHNDPINSSFLSSSPLLPWHGLATLYKTAILQIKIIKISFYAIYLPITRHKTMRFFTR